MGNQACDLDSVVSALSLAYLRSLQVEGECFFPLLPIPAKELKLRTEVTFLFGQVGIDLNLLPCLDSLPFSLVCCIFPFRLKTQLEQKKNSGTLKITLVDHNSLSAHFSIFSSCVVEIIDHHEDLNANFPNLKSKQIEIVGSATTLVVEQLLNDEQGKTRLLADESLRLLLLGTILLDTVGLDPKFGKTFDKDIFFVDYLQKLSPTIHIGTLFKQIQEAKFDTSTLGTAEHLIKDYKQWSTENGISYGIATVLLSIEQWLSKGEDLRYHFKEFSLEHNLSVLFCMLAYQADQETFKRELVIFRPNLNQIDFPKLVYELTEGSGAAVLQLKPLLHVLSFTEKGDVWLFAQNNIKSSRKAFQPLVHDVLSKL